MTNDENIANIWVTKDARFVVIPNEYHDVVINKNGQPDKRYKRYYDFIKWVNEIENEQG